MSFTSNMRYNVRVTLLLFMMLSGIIPAVASGEVLVPESEFAGYFDSNGIYTVVGVVKNMETYPIESHLSLIVISDGKTISVSQDLPSVAPNKDIPFKIRIPQVTDRNAVLEKPTVTFRQSTALPPSDIQVMYDNTLIRHDDGHLTGRITNIGNHTEYDVKVYAAIHGPNNRFMDTGINVEKIEKIEPGQIIEFSIYPDPLVASDVNYYSCFAIGDETVVPLYAIRNGERFNFRYDSTASFTADGFDETGTKLSISGINSFKIQTYVNFEFPKTSDGEKFDVLVDGKPVKFIQSVDEDGNWHVAFDISPSTQNTILISGFENPEGKTESVQSYGTLTYLYVIPIIVAVAVGVYLYKRKN
ncbi:peptidase [Candidatus Nitrosotenuis chungbukensis]|uniref:peptidase n=2 Tax=Candidatus Nitrosotenuis chungbukensis TaxID=1353246 RepID=UPI0026730F67|nr:peptidase [Candidatus Nitrosotenuis chungbukensis]WKT57668.1 peptidase [Candidatus Nitrosotenuis chungbukensis]